ncbi:ATP-binding protein [Streptomyces sp. CA-210063]|uniref:ATP-binding protein n=1 Tax=Streptomyces sp. CA-210063 TaxID=2801029 RepID=UPI0027D46048|nr:ATP-binding protein [Streptomyces sp. CA-210063]
MASVIPPPAPLGTDAAGDRVGPGPAAGARPETIAERRFRFELAAHPGAVAQARRVTRTQLTGWALCEDTCDTAALVVSELVTNAIVHTASAQIVCELHDGDDLVRIAVRDEGCAPGEPHPSPQRPEEEHGRGLLLIESLCRSWGAQPVGLGLLVWADVPRALVAGAVHADAGTGTGMTTSADTAVRSDLGWGAKKPPAEDRGDEAEAFRRAGADGRKAVDGRTGADGYKAVDGRTGADGYKGVDGRNSADGRTAAERRFGAECRREVDVRPEVGRRTGAEWV